jgi:hypothetical protein
MPPGGIRTHDRSRREAVDLRLTARPLGPARNSHVKAIYNKTRQIKFVNWVKCKQN